MNSQPKEIPERSPKSYGPKTPEILNMAKQLNRFGKIVMGRYTIPNVPPSDNPDVGGCGKYLDCFTALQAYIEQIPAERQHDYRNGLCYQYLVTTGISLSTIWSDISDFDNYCFESPILFDATYRFAGYGYEIHAASDMSHEEAFALCSASICANRPVIVSYQCSSDSKYRVLKHDWRLYVGYDTEERSLIYNQGERMECTDWFDGVDKVILLTETGLPRPDIKDVLADVVRAVETPAVEGCSFGYAAYEDLIAYLSDDERFAAMSDEELAKLHQSMKGFFWSHAEARGNMGEGSENLCDGVLAGTKMAKLIGQCMFYGYNGHQISYVSCTALAQMGPAELRGEKLRKILIYGARMLMDNDDKMLSILKEATGITTPSVMLPKDGVYACFDDMRLWASDTPVTARSLLHPDRAMAETILENCKTKNVYRIDFSSDIEPMDAVEYNLADGIANIKTEGSDWEPAGAVSTKHSFALPLKIDAVIQGEERALTLHYSNRPLTGWGALHYGFISNGDWANHPGSFITKDIYVNYGMDYDHNITPMVSDQTEVSWILHRDYMAILVNGQVVHYCENMPYMHFDVSPMPVRFGSVEGKWVKVRSLTVTELI